MARNLQPLRGRCGIRLAAQAAVFLYELKDFQRMLQRLDIGCAEALAMPFGCNAAEMVAEQYQAGGQGQGDRYFHGQASVRLRRVR